MSRILTAEQMLRLPVPKFGYAVPPKGHTTRQITRHPERDSFTVTRTYQTRGPLFVASREYQIEAEDDREHQEFCATVLVGWDVLRAMCEHNRLVDPIDNGPDDAVAASEAVTRLVLANQTFYEDNRRGRFIDDRHAAVLAVQRNVQFNHQPAQ